MAEIGTPGKKEIVPANDVLPQDPVSRKKKSKSKFFSRRVNQDHASQVRTAPGDIETHEKKKKSLKSKAASIFKGKKSNKGDKVQSKKRIDVNLEAPTVEKKRVGSDSVRRHDRTRHESPASQTGGDTPLSGTPDEELDDAFALNLQQLEVELDRTKNFEPLPARQEWVFGKLDHPPPSPPPSPPMPPSSLRGKKTSSFRNPFKRLGRAMEFKGLAKFTKDKQDGSSQPPRVSVHSSHNGKFTVLRMQGNSAPPSRQGSQESLASSKHSAWSDFLFVLPTHKTDDVHRTRDLKVSLIEKVRIQRKYPNAEIVVAEVAVPQQRPPRDPDGGGIVNRIRTFFLKIFKPGEYTRRCEVYRAYERSILQELVKDHERRLQARFQKRAETDAQQARVTEMLKQLDENRRVKEAAEGATPHLGESRK